ncbi:MAG: hypothetical protein V7607_681 [Solirubrobacteraceae bacterium]
MPEPPVEVLALFGVTTRPEALAGGQGTAWRVGDLVLKPLDMSSEALRWQAEVLGDVWGALYGRRGAVTAANRVGRGRAGWPAN